MSSIEDVFEKAVQNTMIPGAVVVANSADGKFHYERAFGVRSLSTKQPMELDTTMWLASCTKLLSTVAAMQCVERGQLELDTDVTSVLYELKGRQILTGFEESTGEPILKDNHTPITLRHLLTHQSGTAYDVFDPLIMQYRAWQKRAFGMKESFQDRNVPDANDFPLIYVPGENWAYSVGADWAGLMVERVNGGFTLEDYMKKNIWAPLGIENITFFPFQNPAIKDRMAAIAWRDGGVTPFGTVENKDAKVIASDETIWNPETKHCHGGAGAYGSVADYAKVLHSLCASDGKLLKTSTIDLMFKPQLSPGAKATVNTTRRQFPEINSIWGGLSPEVDADWGIGGMMNLTPIRGVSAGAIHWGGYPNLVWWVDREGGMSGMMGTQVNQPGDEKINALSAQWREEMYERSKTKGHL